MKAPYDANLLFEKNVEQIEEAVLIGDATGTPHSARQIITTAYNVLHRTGVFKDECKVWHLFEIVNSLEMRREI